MLVLELVEVEEHPTVLVLELVEKLVKEKVLVLEVNVSVCERETESVYVSLLLTFQKKKSPLNTDVCVCVSVCKCVCVCVCVCVSCVVCMCLHGYGLGEWDRRNIEIVSIENITDAAEEDAAGSAESAPTDAPRLKVEVEIQMTSKDGAGLGPLAALAHSLWATHLHTEKPLDALAHNINSELEKRGLEKCESVTVQSPSALEDELDPAKEFKGFVGVNPNQPDRGMYVSQAEGVQSMEIKSTQS